MREEETKDMSLSLFLRVKENRNSPLPNAKSEAWLCQVPLILQHASQKINSSLWKWLQGAWRKSVSLNLYKKKNFPIKNRKSILRLDWYRRLWFTDNGSHCCQKITFSQIISSLFHYLFIVVVVFCVGSCPLNRCYIPKNDMKRLRWGELFFLYHYHFFFLLG